MGTAPVRFTAVPITSRYGTRILWGKRNFHKGVDTSLNGTKYPHSAFATGTVVASPQITKDYERGWYIEYTVDNLPGITISHHSLDKPARFRVGQRVKLGDIIGNAGRSALSATGNHVHNGWWINGMHFDPLIWLKPGQTVNVTWPKEEVPTTTKPPVVIPSGSAYTNGDKVFIAIRKGSYFLALPVAGGFTLCPLGKGDLTEDVPKVRFVEDRAWGVFKTKVSNPTVVSGL